MHDDLPRRLIVRRASLVVRLGVVAALAWTAPAGGQHSVGLEEAAGTDRLKRAADTQRLREAAGTRRLREAASGRRLRESAAAWPLTVSAGTAPIVDPSSTGRLRSATDTSFLTAWVRGRVLRDAAGTARLVAAAEPGPLVDWVRAAWLRDGADAGRLVTDAAAAPLADAARTGSALDAAPTSVEPLGASPRPGAAADDGRSTTPALRIDWAAVLGAAIIDAEEPPIDPAGDATPVELRVDGFRILLIPLVQARPDAAASIGFELRSEQWNVLLANLPEGVDPRSLVLRGVNLDGPTRASVERGPLRHGDALRWHGQPKAFFSRWAAPRGQAVPAHAVILVERGFPLSRLTRIHGLELGPPKETPGGPIRANRSTETSDERDAPRRSQGAARRG